MRRPLFQLGPRTRKRLEILRKLRPRFLLGCKELLEQIGEYCVTQLVDEVDERDIRNLHRASAWRVTHRRLEVLLECGALESTPWGYVVAYFRDDNLPASIRAKRESTKGASFLRAPQNEAKIFVLATSEKVTKTAESPPFFPFKDVLGAVQTATNKTPVAEAECSVSIVPPKKSVVSEETGPVDFDAIARRMMGLQSAPLQPRRDESKEKLGLETGAALHWGLLGEGVGVVPGPQQIPSALTRPLTPAKMPRDSVPANLGTVTQALRDLGVDLSQDERLHAELWRRGVREVEVGYAVWSIQRQRGMGRRVAHTIPYMLSIITKQRQYRGEHV